MDFPSSTLPQVINFNNPRYFTKYFQDAYGVTPSQYRKNLSESDVEMRGVKAPFVINMFYFCDPDGHGPYVQCRDAMPVDEYTPKLGSLTMEDIVATDAQFAGCYFDGLPEQPIERVSMKNVTITFDPNAEAGQAAMADNRPLVKKLAIYAENVKEIDLHNVKIEGYEGERLHFANVGHFEED